MNGARPLLACDDDDEFAPLLNIANALFSEMLILAREVADQTTCERADWATYAPLWQYLETEHPAAGYATVLLEKEIGLRFSGQPFPYWFPIYATAQPGFPLGGMMPEDPGPPPGAIMYVLSRYWALFHEDAEHAQGEQAESRAHNFGSVLRGCIHVGYRHGFEAGIRYIYDLVDSGQVLFPTAAVQAAARVLRAVAAVGDERDLFIDILEPPPTTVRAAIEREADLACRDDPPVGDAPQVSAVLSQLLAACWGRIRQLQDAADAGDWIFNLAGLEALIRFTDGTIRLTMDRLSPVMESALRQLEEISADCHVAWHCLERGDFTGFVDYQRYVQSEMVRNSGSQARGESRFRRERLMVPSSLILESGQDEEWACPGPACGRLIASFHQEDLELTPSPFGVGATPRPEITHSDFQPDRILKEATDLLRQGRTGEGTALLTRLRKRHPWSWTALTRLGQALSQRQPREAAHIFAEALVLRPSSPGLWQDLQQVCQAAGRDRAAGVAGRMAVAFSRTSRS